MIVVASSQVSSELSRVPSDVLRTQKGTEITVGQLEQALLALFPAQDAEEWDKTGLLVGNPHEVVTGVAIALDAHATAINQAQACGVNVLVTHHPAFIAAPEQFGPMSSGYTGSEAAVYQAARDGIALINVHTALDVSVQAHHVLPGMLNLTQVGVLHPLAHDASKGYGQQCVSEEPLTLEVLAARVTAVFGRIPRVWGNPSTQLSSLVTATGSGSSLIDDCLKQGIDCFICGELRYHDALAAAEAGLCMIELGHDVSELPLCAVLAAACEQVGIDQSHITMLDQGSNWWTPEATRR